MASSATVQPVPANRRASYRQKLRSLAYVRLDSNNDGVLRDVSPSGIAVQVLSTLRQDQKVHLRLDLANPRLRFDAEARVAWSDSAGQAGLEFVDVPTGSRRLLKEWMFTQILADAHLIVGDDTGQLLFSSPARPAIRFESKVRPADRRSIRLLGFDVSALKFSRFVDALALLCAVLLFSVLALVLTDILPSWFFIVAFVLGIAAAFATLYWLIFAVWFGITPGSRLAELANADAVKKARRPKLERARFR